MPNKMFICISASSTCHFIFYTNYDRRCCYFVSFFHSQMSFFLILIFWVAFCFAKNRLFRVPASKRLHSFATLRNWLRQPLQSLPRFKTENLKLNLKIYNNFCIYIDKNFRKIVFLLSLWFLYSVY